MVGYIAFNFNKTKLLYPFEYIEFNEEEIDKTLEENFQWEFDIYNPSSWRIGDGTAPFYNFIYWEYCGFTENDFFRSNQIRDGKLNRSEALKKTLFENQSKEVRIREYLKYINADYDLVIKSSQAQSIKTQKLKIGFSLHMKNMKVKMKKLFNAIFEIFDNKMNFSYLKRLGLVISLISIIFITTEFEDINFDLSNLNIEFLILSTFLCFYLILCLELHGLTI